MITVFILKSFSICFRIKLSTMFSFKRFCIFRISVSCIRGCMDGGCVRITATHHKYRAGKCPHMARIEKSDYAAAGGKKDEAEWRKAGVNYLGLPPVRVNPDRPKARVNANCPLHTHILLHVSRNLSIYLGLRTVRVNPDRPEPGVVYLGLPPACLLYIVFGLLALLHF